MDLTQFSPDEVVYWEWGFVHLNGTIVFTWIVMALMILGAVVLRRKITADVEIPAAQNAIEVVVEFMQEQIREISGEDDAAPYLPFIGTLFLFIAVANALTIVPGYIPPTASLSTTAALAIAVFIAVPVFAITRQGVAGHLKHYVEPTPIMLPFNLVGEVSRTLALAVRLFGNVMSAAKIVAVLLAVIPFFFPIVFQALGLLTGMIQAYIFAILAMVYIASGMATTPDRDGAVAHDTGQSHRPQSPSPGSDPRSDRHDN